MFQTLSSSETFKEWRAAAFEGCGVGDGRDEF
jgi:hypothetical protein